MICPFVLANYVTWSQKVSRERKKNIRENSYSETKGKNYLKYSFIIAEVKMKQINVSETISHLTYEIVGYNVIMPQNWKREKNQRMDEMLIN